MNVVMKFRRHKNGRVGHYLPLREASLPLRVHSILNALDPIALVDLVHEITLRESWS